RRERRDQILHALLEGDEETPTRAGDARLARAAARAPEPEDDRALLLLELGEARHRGREAQVVGIGGVDPGDERLGDTLEGLPAEPPSHERAQAFVVGDPAGQDEVERHAERARPGEEPGGEKRREPRRGQELPPVGQRVQAPSVPDEYFPVAVVGARESVLQAQTTAKGERPRLLRQEGVRAGLDEKATGAIACASTSRSYRSST